ncbi:MAG TPA: tRNA-dihydrouridine synthase [Planctomycetaceae bacterium]|nr:tRNA-dihydrouridine synthase [Planctomycetaceae bacterium]
MIRGSNSTVIQSATGIPTRAAEPIDIGGRILPSRFFLAPLAGYTHLAFRLVLRGIGGLGLATTDLVLASMLWSERKKSLDLVETSPDDRPLSVQIFSGETEHLVKAAVWLQDHGYEGIDINMGCPMAKVNSSGGGARLMCNVDGAVGMVSRVMDAVRLPVTVKMRLGWDAQTITAPELAAAFEDIGVAAVTVHGRTRSQGFHGGVDRDGIRQTVDAVRSMPIIANGDVRTPQDAFSMMHDTGCAAVAIGRGAMLDPWIFRRIQRLAAGDTAEFEPTVDEQIGFLANHFSLMTRQHDEHACVLFRKFAAWYGSRLGIPEDLEDRLRRFESYAEFDDIVEQIRRRHGERMCSVPTALVKTPNGPVEHW